MFSLVPVSISEDLFLLSRDMYAISVKDEVSVAGGAVLRELCHVQRRKEKGGTEDFG